jgi:flavin reductase (DIM6/NTAB) family NADH-FMN oxidoreductase RutF
MRHVPHSVVVCTTSTLDGTPRAMTMSSFTSLTLTPPAPLITFNIAGPSRTLDAISASRAFNIHVMAGDANGAALADHFTRGNADEGELFAVAELEKLGATTSGLTGQKGPPLLDGEAVLYVLRCRVLDDEPSIGLVRVRDHVIVIGEVVEIVGTRGQEGGELGLGLAYADRRYRRVGEMI